MYLEKIYKPFGGLRYLSENLSPCIEDKSISRDMLISSLEEIKDIIEIQRADITVYCKEKNIAFSEYAENIYNACNGYISSAIKIAKNEEIAEMEAFEKSFKQFAMFGCLIEEKYEEYIEDWIIDCIETDNLVSKDYFILQLDEHEDQKDFYQFLYFILVALNAEKLFFSANRNRSPETQKILTEFEEAHFNKKNEPINLQEKSGRTIITASSGAVIRSLANIDQQALANGKALDATKWSKTGNAFGTTFQVERGEVKYVRKESEALIIHGQFMPAISQIANEYIKGVDTYDEIMQLFHFFTNSEPAREKALANLLLRYKLGDSNALSEDELKKNEMNLPTGATQRRDKISKLNKTAYLICFVEVHRRIPQDHLFKDFPINTDQLPETVRDAISKPQLPFGLAISLLLIMLSDGVLRFNQVFNKKSEYGMFTHDSVMNKNITETLKRLVNIISTYEFYYLSEEAPNIGYISKNFIVLPTSEYFHSILKKTDGGEEDSDGEDYHTAKLPKDEEASLLRSFELLRTNFSGPKLGLARK